MKTIRNFNAAERRIHNQNLHRLKSAGVAVGEPNTEKLLRIEQTSDGVLHAPAIGGYVIAAWLRIVALKARITIIDYAITPCGWKDDGIYLLDNQNDRFPYFRDIAELNYPKHDVLNDLILKEQPLGCGEVVNGVLVAQSLNRAPDWFSTGLTANLELCLFDQFENTHPLEIALLITRDIKHPVRTEREPLFRREIPLQPSTDEADQDATRTKRKAL